MGRWTSDRFGMRRNEWNKAHELRPDKQTKRGVCSGGIEAFGRSAALPTAIDVVMGSGLESDIALWDGRMSR